MGIVWLKDVAEAAGVSVSAASHAVNGTGSLATKTRERINKLAKEMGYTKSPHLSAIASRRFRGTPKYIPLVYLSLAHESGGMDKNPFVHKQALEEAGRPMGLNLSETKHLRSLKEAETFLDKAYHRGVEGLLIGHSDAHELLRTVDLSRFSVLCVGDVPSRIPYHRIEWDWADATRTATRKLLAAGCQRIGTILPSQEKLSYYDRNRLGAFLAEMHGRQPLPPYLKMDPKGLLDWFTTHCPDGLVSFGVASLYYLEERGFCFPKDARTAVVSLSASSEGQSDAPDWNEPFAGNLRKESELARHAMRTLYNLIAHHEKGIATPPVAHFVRMAWKDGMSLGTESPEII